MNCSDMEILVHGYMDGELDAVTRNEVEDHLRNCEICRQELASFRAVGEGLRKPEVYYWPLADFVSTVRRSVLAERAPVVFRLRRTFALAASILIVALTILGITQFRRGPSHEAVVASEVAANYVDTGGRVSVASPDAGVVAKWLYGNLAYVPPVPRLPGAPYVLAGARIDSVNHRRVATVVYHVGADTIDLSLWPTKEPSSQPSPSRSVRGCQVVYWRSGGTDYWVAASTAGDASQFARAVFLHAG